ncbi:hypothetical protein NIES4073_80080 [Kalymmatonema gypsitolerans NIES-4073]|nr:hypothetical protein NIES4073_80080 [Scytonema sp. NIES-4073]
MQEGFPRPGDWRWRSLWGGDTPKGSKGASAWVRQGSERERFAVSAQPNGFPSQAFASHGFPTVP